MPEHPELRVEADLNLKHSTGNKFDPLLLKLIARGADRKQALHLLQNSIRELNVIGPETNAKYLENILDHDHYQKNNISVEFCKNNHLSLIRYADEQPSRSVLTYLIAVAVAKNFLKIDSKTDIDPWKHLGYWRLTTSLIPLAIDDHLYHIQLHVNDKTNTHYVWNGTKTEFKATNTSANSIEISINRLTKRFFYHSGQQAELRIAHENAQRHVVFPELLKNHPQTSLLPANETKSETSEITSPMHGKILEIFVKENQLIKKNEPLLIIEAMKSENKILSHKDAKIRKIVVHVGTQVTDRMPLIFLED